ncbi:MAG: glycosyltransferase family 87 protein [Mucilaginibacter sp.]
MVIAPFALLPDGAGVIGWVLFNAWILYQAVRLLPVTETQRLLILLLCAHELMTSAANVQSNPLIAALIIFSFVLIREKKDFWAALMIVLGLFIKLYGVAGLAFFFFSKQKTTLITSVFFWSLVLFLVPMFISSPAFIIRTYGDWYSDLVAKNATNIISTREDISVMGMIRKTAYPALPNMAVVVPAVLLFALAYVRYNLFGHLRYQLLVLASALIFPVIFSTGSESPTYIIAFAGVAIWFIKLERPVSVMQQGLLIFALMVTSFSPSDLFPGYIRAHYIVPYALKALPCFFVWLHIIYETLTRKFTEHSGLPVPIAYAKENFDYYPGL